MDGHDDYRLLLAFDSDDPEFTRGFEAGRVWHAVQHDPLPIVHVIHYSNAEMAMRIAEAMGQTFHAQHLDDGMCEVTIGAEPGDPPARSRPAFWHNVIAHPLLVLIPPLGRWLHESTRPTR